MILRKHFCNALHYRMSILIFTILFLRLPVIFAQDKMPVNFGDIGREDFAINQSQAGSNSNALIIADIGTTKFEGNTKGWFSYIFKRQTRIKLINQNGFDAATSAIYFIIIATEQKRQKILVLLPIPWKMGRYQP